MKCDRSRGLKAWARALAMGFFALAQGAAWAGFKNVVTLSSGRQTLENNMVYIVNKDITVKAGGTGGGDWRKNSSWDGKADVGYNNTDSTGGGNADRAKALETFVNGVDDIKIGIKAYSRQGN